MTLTAWLRWRTLEPLLPSDAHRVLDIGAGAGSLGLLLASRYDYTGIEPDPVSYATAVKLIGDRGTVRNLGFEALEAHGDFDLVCAFEVLEHIQDDAGALANWVRHLRPGGWLLVTVPHGQRRYGAGDAWSGHYRRYDASDLLTLFESVGLDDSEARVYGSPWGNIQEALRGAVFRIRPTKQTRAERTAQSGRLLQPPAWAAGLVRALSTPLARLQRPLGSRGIGTGVVVRGRRPAEP